MLEADGREVYKHGYRGKMTRLFLVPLGFAACLLSAAPGAAKAPRLSFAPLDPILRPEVGIRGSRDYMDLFRAGAPWGAAAAHINVFKLYPQFLERASDAELRRVIEGLRQRHIALGAELGVLPASTGCGRGIEGYGASGAVAGAARLKRLGGDLRYVLMDEPLWFGHDVNRPNACHAPIGVIAEQAAQAARSLRRVFPYVEIGDGEPISNFPKDEWRPQIARWIDAYRAAAGKPLAFLVADVDWQKPWLVRLVALQKLLHRRRIGFGIIYNASPDDSTDEAWLDATKRHFEEFESDGRTAPDDAIFQSWAANPTRVLPETSATAFTHLILDYLRKHSSITLETSGGVIRGRVSGEDGRGIAGARVLIEAPLRSNATTPMRVVTSGTVPPGATRAVMAVRVNAECGCSSPVHMSLLGLRYREAGRRPVERRFSGGLAGWGVKTTATLRPGGAARPGVGALQISAAAEQMAQLNSTPFTVAPNEKFDFRADFAAGRGAAKGAYFAVIFLGASGKEVSRIRLPPRPPTEGLGTATTATNGDFRLEGPFRPGIDLSRANAIFSGDKAYRGSRVRWRGAPQSGAD